MIISSLQALLMSNLMSLKSMAVLSLPPLYYLISFMLNPEVGSTAARGNASSLHVHFQGPAVMLSLSLGSLGTFPGRVQGTSLQSHWPELGHMPIDGLVPSKENQSVPALGVACTSRRDAAVWERGILDKLSFHRRVGAKRTTCSNPWIPLSTDH